MSGGPVRDCAHPRARHLHGTHLAYQLDGCRCEACRRAGARAAKLTAYRTATGTHSYVDAVPARAHVTLLLRTLTVGQVEQRSGLDRTAVRLLVGTIPGRPASRRTRRATEAALLAVRGDRVGPETHGLVDRAGTTRRLRGLVALGWTARHLAARLRMSSRTMARLLADDGGQIRVGTRARVTALYDGLAMTLPAPRRGTTIARRVAASHGWHPPLAWDDDTIDDPAARPYPLRDDWLDVLTARARHRAVA